MKPLVFLAMFAFVVLTNTSCMSTTEKEALHARVKRVAVYILKHEGKPMMQRYLNSKVKKGKLTQEQANLIEKEITSLVDEQIGDKK